MSGGLCASVGYGGAPAAEALPFLTQDAWFVNATTGNDNNDGETAGTAILTLAELSRRLNGKVVDPSMATLTITLTGAFPGQVLAPELQIPGVTNVNVVGSMTTVDSGTVTAYTATNSATATRSQLTDAAQDFTAYVWSRIRLTSGVGSGAVAWICSPAGGITSVYTTDFLLPPTAAAVTGTQVNPGVGDSYVIEFFATSCAAHQIRLTGMQIQGQNIAVVRDVSFARTSGTLINSSSSSIGVSLAFFGCEYFCNGGNHNISGNSFQQLACGFRSSTTSFGINYNGPCRVTEYNCGFFCFSGQNTALVRAQYNYHDGNAVRNAYRALDIDSTLHNFQHRGFFNCTNVSVDSLIRLRGNSTWIDDSSARTWGGAGNLNTVPVRVRAGQFQYVNLPTVTASVPGNDFTLAGGAPLAWALAPAAAAPPDIAAIFVRL